jgi:hypothetical protein
MKNSVGGGARK